MISRKISVGKKISNQIEQRVTHKRLVFRLERGLKLSKIPEKFSNLLPCLGGKPEKAQAELLFFDFVNIATPSSK